MYAPNLGTPADVIARLIRLLERWGVQCFVDAGCGDGDVLVAVARADATRRCIGIEIDPATAARTAERIIVAGLRNAEVLQGNALDASDVLDRADCVYAYLGGALHQALGHRLAERRCRARYLTALYPAIDLPASGTDTSCSLPLDWYEPASAHGRVVWDSPLSISVAYAGGAQLSCRTATVYGDGVLDARVIGESELPVRVGVELGRRKVVRGAATVIDVVVKSASRRAVPAARCEIELTLDGQPLLPRHVMVVGTRLDRAVEHRVPFRDIELDTALELAASAPSSLVQLVIR